MTKIVLFNGPPRSGKDTATGMAISFLPNAIHYRFASPLKDAIHGLFGMPMLVQEHFDKVKDEPRKEFLGMTPREAYIWLSEEVVKPKFGNDFFSKIAAKWICANAGEDTVIISDCGFQTEADVLIDEFGVENVLIVQIYRPNCSFNNDSRNYVKSDNAVFLSNETTKEDLQENVKKILEEFVHGSSIN